MAMMSHTHETPQALGRQLAVRILAGINEAEHEGRPYVLGCPGGRSPQPVYEALAEILKETPTNCSHLIIAMMDEYLLMGKDGHLSPPPAAAHYSCRGFGARDIVGRINHVLPESYRIQPTNFRMPDAENPSDYDSQLARLGGVDLFLLASGAGDGHIAFNPPGSARNSKTRIVTLAEQTRRDNMATFPNFRALEEVPTHGVTIGIDSIASLSRAVAMIVWGEDKRQAYKRLAEAQKYDSNWPATILTECHLAELHADQAAVGG